MCQTVFPELRRTYSTGGCPFSYMGTANNAAHVGFNLCPAAVSPTNTTVAMNQMICSGNSTTLNAVGSGTLGWYNSASGGAYLGSGPSLNTQTLTTNTTYYVQDSVACGASPRTPITVTVNALPTVSVSSSLTGTICAGQSVTLTANGANTYSWSTGSTNTSIVVTPSVTSSYTTIGTSSATNCSGTDNITVNVATCLGINESSIANNSLRVYPNPSNGNFTLIVNNNCTVAIMNLIGQEVAKYELEAGENQINLSAFSNGIYLIRVSTNYYNKSLRIIKNNN